jgi:hypothetical protein
VDINNRIVTTYMARVGNALAVQGQIENSMLRGGRAAGYQARQLGAMEQQMRAFGTTVRYALAGTAIFGITSMIGKLNQLQQQLGLISAIAPTAGVNFTQSGLSQYLDEVTSCQRFREHLNLKLWISFLRLVLHQNFHRHRLKI